MNITEFYPLFLQSNSIVIDSRKIEKGDLFFAFSGVNFDAATLADEAIEKGALAVIVEQERFANLEKNIIYVPSTLDFLQQLALYHREQLHIPIIGLTGSNGKTTTKELIHAVLSQKYSVQYTKGNLNNHIGVPLTILSIRNEHQMAVIEMGANHQKEIAQLCSIAQPTIGYITNFGKAHLEGFGGIEGVIKGKSELYDYLISTSGYVLVNSNDPIQMDKTKEYPHIISFGTDNANYTYNEFSKDCFVGVDYQGTQIVSHLTGNYNFTNLCAAVTLGLHFGVEFAKIASAIENYHPTNMRSQVVKRGRYTLVLDTYNANPSSMNASLHNFATYNGSKTIIIGDMLELGIESAHEHRQILEVAISLGFDEIITVGKNFMDINNKTTAFENSEALIMYLKSNQITSDNVLLKASRGIALEKIIDYLRE